MDAQIHGHTFLVLPVGEVIRKGDVTVRAGWGGSLAISEVALNLGLAVAPNEIVLRRQDKPKEHL